MKPDDINPTIRDKALISRTYENEHIKQAVAVIKAARMTIQESTAMLSKGASLKIVIDFWRKAEVYDKAELLKAANISKEDS